MFSLCAALPARAQDPSPEPADTSRGVRLYRQGDTKGAVEVLRGVVERDRTDADAWHYFGLALEREGDPAGAARALEQAARLRLRRFAWVNPSASRKGDFSVHLDERFADAAESLEKYLELNPDAAGAWRERLEAVRFYARFYGQKKDDGQKKGDARRDAYSPEEVTEPAVILEKPEPAVQKKQHPGGSWEVVVLLVTLAADGQVRHVVTIQHESPAYTRAAVEAARRLKFKPAKKGRRPVSVVQQLTY